MQQALQRHRLKAFQRLMVTRESLLGSVPQAVRLPLNASADLVGQFKETRYHDAVCYFVHCSQADKQGLCAVTAHAGTGVQQVAVTSQLC